MLLEVHLEYISWGKRIAGWKKSTFSFSTVNDQAKQLP